MNLYADFHIHIGQSYGHPVKMAAAKALTLDNLIHHARFRKGLDIVTVIDGICDGPLHELHTMVDEGLLQPLPGGGLRHTSGLVLLIGAEIEVGGPTGGAAHFGCWLPDLDSADDFSSWLKTVQKNTSLSSQRARTSATALQNEVMARGGMFIVHHAFTPHKGLYGNCVDRLSDMVDENAVDALELGLSADADMADRVSELANVTFISNSDAHSAQKIAREYNQITLDEIDFAHVQQAFARSGNNRITANFGLDPLLGKYHYTACRKCGRRVEETPCTCGSSQTILGVSERLDEIADVTEPSHPNHRPPYIHQIPLEFIPGLGPKAMSKLYEAFSTEMDILHRRTVEEIGDVVGTTLAHLIDEARNGRAVIQPGHGGIYGKVLA